MLTVDKAQSQIRTIICRAFSRAQENGLIGGGELLDFNIEIPADRANGDFSSNAAMANARAFRCAPVKIAAAITESACLEGTYFSRVESAGPGFLNFYLNDEYYADALLDVVRAGEDYGRCDYGKGERVNVEFVSANPTGPMHMGNARGGALGDCLAGVLEYLGYDVEREFYVNDAGNQIEKFAYSLDVRYRQLFLGEQAVPLDEDSYHGADIIEHAKGFAELYGDSYMSRSEQERKKALVDFALPKNLEQMKAAMEKYRIEYNTWFSEKTLHDSGEIARVIELLTEKGYTYEKDGALWYKNILVQTQMLTEQGRSEQEISALELKDDVLVRANGNPTYFAADIAYHRNKLVERGFDRAIDVWGADHHGHVARMKGAMKALGISPDRLDIVLMQFVRLVQNGEVVRMSKRTGKAITLTDLLQEVPIDAVRFMFNVREPGSLMDFDLDLAVEQSSQNPVYYCQYAHARICSIISRLEQRAEAAGECTRQELMSLQAEQERQLISHLAELEHTLILAANSFDPAKVTHYAAQLAALFHRFYNCCRVDVEDEALFKARLTLCVCVKNTLKSILGMMKINAPESM